MVSWDVGSCSNFLSDVQMTLSLPGLVHEFTGAAVLLCPAGSFGHLPPQVLTFMSPPPSSAVTSELVGRGEWCLGLFM